jgi:hypothetical protein
MTELSFSLRVPIHREKWESLIILNIWISACLTGMQVFTEMTNNKYFLHRLHPFGGDEFLNRKMVIE